MVVLRVKGSLIMSKEGLLYFQRSSDDVVIIFGVNRSGVFGRGI